MPGQLSRPIDMERYPAWYMEQLASDRRVEGSSLRLDGSTYIQSAVAESPSFLDGRLGSLSLWWNPLLADTQQMVFDSLTRGLRVIQEADNTVTVAGLRADGGVAVSIASSAPITIDGKWKHLLSSFDNQLAAPTEHLYINDADLKGAVVNNDDDIAYSSMDQLRVGNDAGATLPYDGWTAEIWGDVTVQIDFSDVNRRRQFVSSQRGRVDLGKHGTRPLAAKPSLYYQGGRETFTLGRGIMGNLKEAPAGEILTRQGQIIKAGGSL